MFELEPGPLEYADPDGMRRLAPRPSFTGIVADGLSDTAGLRGALDGAAVGVTDNPSEDLDGTYATTIGIASDVVGNEITTAPPSPVPTLLENGASADTIRESVKQYLPTPDVPISASFTDPPAAPGQVSDPTPHDDDGGRV
jgi:hypothetical protein